MRIIAGEYRRKPLKAPKGNETRPSTDRTRESLFNLVEARMELDGALVLDLFAGTGALGLEAISRGARIVTMVEKSPEALRFAKANAASLGVEQQCRLLRQDAVTFISRYTGPPFDLILADPPYELESLPGLPDLVLPHVKPGGLFVLEHDLRHRFAEHPHLNTSRPYGRTIVTVFTPEPDGDETED